MPDPVIYVMCPDINEPRGGLRVLYRHVDLLNANGFSATAVHYGQGFRARWFENSTRIVYMPIELKPSDVVVFPEIEGPRIAEAVRGIRKVIFNQNAYYTFQHYPVEVSAYIRAPYQHREVVASIVVSEDSREYLRHAFPGITIHRIRQSIDPHLFHPQSPKKKQICFMPRKHVEDAQQIINILRYRGVLSGFRVVAIDGKPQEEAAETLRESSIFLSFGYPEGFGRPPAEAMACGCITIGYHGNGGREYMKPELSFPIEAGDIIGFAKAAEKAIQKINADSDAFVEMTMRAAEFVRTTYSPANERADIISCWKKILHT